MTAPIPRDLARSATLDLSFSPFCRLLLAADAFEADDRELCRQSSIAHASLYGFEASHHPCKIIWGGVGCLAHHDDLSRMPPMLPGDYPPPRRMPRRDPLTGAVAVRSHAAARNAVPPPRKPPKKKLTFEERRALYFPNVTARCVEG